MPAAALLCPRAAFATRPLYFLAFPPRGGERWHAGNARMTEKGRSPFCLPAPRHGMKM